MITAAFDPVRTCWICDGTTLTPVHELIFELSAYGTQDAELAAYTGSRLALCRCARCGFAQPAALPALPRYFDRMYDQRWSDDWIRNEFEADYKDEIFAEILGSLAGRLGPARRRLLDVGAHAGRFVSLAQRRRVDGRRTGAESEDGGVRGAADRRADPAAQRARRQRRRRACTTRSRSRTSSSTFRIPFAC